MKKIILSFLFLSFAIIGAAQSVSGALGSVEARQIKDKLLVCGIDETQTPSVFKATIYDKNLNIIKEYSRKLGLEFKGNNFNLIVYGSKIQVNFLCKGHGDDEYLDMTTDLQEITSGITAVHPAKVSFMYVPLSERPSPFYGYVDPGQKFLGDDLVSVFYTSKAYYATGTFSLVPYVGKPSIKRVAIKDSLGNSAFRVIWDTDLGLYYAGSHNVFYMDENKIFFLVNGNELNEQEHTFLFIVDSRSGKLLKKEVIQMPDNKADLNNAKGYFDADNNTLIIAGEANQADRKLAIFFYDKEGKFISVKTGGIPSFTGITAPKNYMINRDENFVRGIGKNSKGNYFVQTETMVKREAGAYSRFDKNGNAYNDLFVDVPMAYSYYEVNSKNELVNSKNVSIKNFADYASAKYYAFSPNGKSMLISNVFDKKRTTEIVDLYSGSDSFKKLFEFDYNPKKIFLEDYIHQFMMDDQTVIVMHRTGDNSYELKSIKY